MSGEEWALIASVVFSGLWSGLLAMLTQVLHPMMAEMTGPEFSGYLHRFLPVARKALINYITVLGMVIAPAVALFALDTGDTAFALTAVGLALTVAGPLLISNRLAEPNYDVMLSWNPDRMPEDWEAVRRKYFVLDWIRAACTWAAFALFLAALLEVA
jgi:hypothetical protein